jgi:hypothetical protein
MKMAALKNVRVVSEENARCWRFATQRLQKTTATIENIQNYLQRITYLAIVNTRHNFAHQVALCFIRFERKGVILLKE